MSLEGKEEKEVAQMVYCMGINGMLKLDSCGKDCGHFGGIKEEPIRKRDNDGNVSVVGCNSWVLCKYPKPEKVLTLMEI